MERARVPESVLILIVSLLDLMAMMITHFVHWNDFINGNREDFDELQLNLLVEHITHLLTFISFLWYLVIAVMTMGMQDT